MKDFFEPWVEDSIFTCDCGERVRVEGRFHDSELDILCEKCGKNYRFKLTMSSP